MHTNPTPKRRVRLLGILGLALALSAVLSASAQAAEPEFVGAPNLATFYSTTIAMETPGEYGVCRKVVGPGSTVNPKSGTAKLEISECGSLPGLCYGKLGASPINTTELEMVPVYISKASHLVGILFRPKTGNTFAKLICPSGFGALVGSVVAKVSPINTLTTHFTLTFESNLGAIQSPSYYEAENGEHVNSWLELERAGFTNLRESWQMHMSLDTSKAMKITG